MSIIHQPVHCIVIRFAVVFIEEDFTVQSAAAGLRRYFLTHRWTPEHWNFQPKQISFTILGKLEIPQRFCMESQARLWQRWSLFAEGEGDTTSQYISNRFSSIWSSWQSAYNVNQVPGIQPVLLSAKLQLFDDDWINQHSDWFVCSQSDALIIQGQIPQPTSMVW